MWRKLRNINGSLMQKIKNLKDLGWAVCYLQSIHNNFVHNALEFIERNHPFIYCSLWWTAICINQTKIYEALVP